MALIDAGLRGALIALLALVIAALVPHWRHARHAHLVRISISLAASLIVQTLSASPWAEHQLSCPVQAPGIGLSLGSAVLFWLFARAVFEDGFRLRAWHVGLWAAVAAYGGTLCLWGGWWPGWVLMRAVPIVFALLGLACVVGPWRVDLVEPRRRLRGLVVGGGAAYALVLVVMRVRSADGSLSSDAALGDVAMLLVLTALVAGRLLAPRADGLWGEAEALPPAPPAPPAADAQDQLVATALARLMGEGRGYAQEGLSLAGLAEQLGTAEYRLRRVINQHLGHRNFTAYVNGQRLAEAKRRLADPAERGLPVLSIALDVGFGSIGPFNRAFKADTGLTPTEFRQKSLADS
ncbi:helix-turn-helix domain-containing protein [Roseateles cellulosilyticus]|uniref:AraC family transcriptional regulator n=1 Tax=Pelomonas cellulosilytica TaxID=2906762 RepID=A0ABS8XR84_9BURK|nr:helix-turn-helix domain-containing protein [Pelomonas sp. P8]MCE4553184.1 AraC family transcriptional regulator [Pelomonas sp. P8]